MQRIAAAECDDGRREVAAMLRDAIIRGEQLEAELLRIQLEQMKNEAELAKIDLLLSLENSTKSN